MCTGHHPPFVTLLAVLSCPLYVHVSALPSRLRVPSRRVRTEDPSVHTEENVGEGGVCVRCVNLRSEYVCTLSFLDLGIEG